MQNASKDVRTIQFSNQADPVVNDKTLTESGIMGSKEIRMKGVADKDYHLNDDPSKGHSLTDFSDKIKDIPKKQ